jgi:hypothetical protein
VREAVAFLLLACACGAATVKGRADDAQRLRRNSRADAADGGGGASGGGDRSFVSLEGRATVVAPGLHQAAERETGGERVELVRAASHDACVRVAFESSSPVTARLLDADGGVLAEMHAAAAEGVLGEHGPVCIRRGDAVSAVAEGSGVRVKWIAWTSP